MFLHMFDMCNRDRRETLSLSLSLLAFRWNRIVWNKQYFNIIRIYIFFFFVHSFVANWNSFEWNSIVPGQEKFSRRTVKKCLVKSVKLVTCFQTFLEIDNRPTLYTREHLRYTYTQGEKVNWIWLRLKQDYTLLYSETKVSGIGSIINNM